MALFNGLPVYQATITDDECGVFCVSLVTDPATEVDFVTFDADKPIQKFAVNDKKEHLVSGVIMLCDTPIYRRTASNYEYYITYSRETLKVMAEKMIKDGVGSSINIQHQDGTEVSGVNLMELFLINKENGVCPSYFKDVPDGSLIGTYKVNNPDVWAMIENGEVLSFSLEGIFALEQTFNKQENKKNNITMKIEKIKEVLRKILASFGSIATDKGTVVWQGDDDLKEGDSVNGVDAEGGETELEDGEYRTEDKKIITIENGIVVSIVDSEAEVAPENEPEETPEETPEEKPEETPEEEPKEEPKEEEEPEEEPEEAPAQEEEPAEEEAPATDEKDEKIASLEGEVASLKEENEALKARIKELEGESAAEPANEQFKKAEEKNSKVSAMERRGYKF